MNYKIFIVVLEHEVGITLKLEFLISTVGHHYV